MPTTRKPATRGPSRPTSRKPRAADPHHAEVTLRLSYTEASLLMVGASLAMGLADRPGADDEDRAMAGMASNIVDKLYEAEPALKRDAGRVESEMQSFFAELSDTDADLEALIDIDDDADDASEDEAMLQGEGWLSMIVDAAQEKQELALRIAGNDGQERHLHPLGAGQIGGVAVAIGWSEDARDFAAVRLDKVDAVRTTGKDFATIDDGLTEACLDRFDRQSQRDHS